ncbi:MAG: winged helix-turn-helix transcriptional regulator [Actinophytocola sp.]|uniref:winged helix-turn-helix transcriptional regulator n=1 Tax=Actinophytocola sp. TaxID=1872138 RepID=UPI003C71E1D5
MRVDDYPGTEDADTPGRSYRQFCGIARAFEIIGSPWSALIVRDLLLGPKPRADLAELLPRLSFADLDERLGELAAAGVVARSGADSSPVYELTDYGKDLEPILLQLGRWGARSLGDPRLGDLFTLDMAILALRATFRPERARGVHTSFEVRFGDLVVSVRVDDGALTVEEGELPGADLIVDTPVLKHLMAAELSPTDALWLGLIEPQGDPARLATFVDLFHIPPAPDLPDLETVS